MWAGASGVASGGDMTQDFERTRGIALDICDCYKENHDRVGRLVTAGVRRPANDALEVCAFKVPALITESQHFPLEVVLES